MKHIFYSSKSIQQIQLLIKVSIYQITHILIYKQSEQSLRLIMDAVYNNAYIDDDLETLQFKTAKIAIENILPNLKQHIIYVENLDKPKMLQSLPQNTSGNKVKQSLSFHTPEKLY